MRQQQVKEQILWQHAMIGLLDEKLIARFCDHKMEFTKPWDRYPELFVEEKRLYKQQAEAEKALSMGESRRAYAAEFNRRRR
ncbi:MAG: hypothetical protein H2212_00260 [Ruminococcus sp.]|nr:hypothetical protein [Ruminococcus sp.]